MVFINHALCHGGGDKWQTVSLDDVAQPIRTVDAHRPS